MNRLQKIIGICLASCLFSSSYGATIGDTTMKHRQLFLKLAYASHQHVKFNADSFSLSSTFNQHLNSGDRYNGLGIGAGFFFPLVQQYGFAFDAVTYMEYIPGGVVSSQVNNAGVITQIASVKNARYNLGLGINGQYFIRERIYVQGQISAGITAQEVRGEVARFNDVDQGSDHPGITSHEPFVAVEAGVGYQVDSQTQLEVFGNMGVAHHGGPTVLGEQGLRAATYLNLDVPHKWYQVGLNFRRDINL